MTNDFEKCESNLAKLMELTCEYERRHKNGEDVDVEEFNRIALETIELVKTL